jgi:hypothetical protein
MPVEPSEQPHAHIDDAGEFIRIFRRRDCSPSVNVSHANFFIDGQDVAKDALFREIFQLVGEAHAESSDNMGAELKVNVNSYR